MTTQELNTLVGRNIKFFRKKKGWTQAKTALETGICNNTLCDFEKGKHLPSCRTMAILAFVLGVEVWQLFYEKN